MTDRVVAVLAKYLDAPVECDGFTRLAHTALLREGISHEVRVGSLSENGEPDNGIPLHYWIVLGDGRIVDYKARLWLGEDSRVPHGVFAEAAFPDWLYQGEPISISPLSPTLERVLMAPFLPVATDHEQDKETPHAG